MDRDRIITNGWRQGVCIAVEQFPQAQQDALLSKGMNKNDIMVVINQDCDVVCDCLDKEPVIELMRAVPCTEPNRAHFNAKNARHLVVPAPKFLGEPFLSLSINDRAILMRDFVETHDVTEVPRIDGDDLYKLKTWLGARYNRASFPDELIARIKPGLDRMESRLGRMAGDEYVSKYVQGIYMHVEPDDEVAEGDAYNLYCFALVHPDITKEAYEKTEQAMDDLVKNIDPSVIVQTQDSLVRQTTEITVEEIMRYKRYYFDFISLKHGEPSTGVE